MKSQKYEKQILEMYRNMSPSKIRKTAYTQQKKLINNNPNEDYDYQMKVISICRDKNPVAYLLGCSDAMEEELNDYKPNMLMLGPEFKDVLLRDVSDTTVNMFFEVSGAVDPITIQDLIKEYRSGNISGNELIISLENAIEESWKDTRIKNKKYLE